LGEEVLHLASLFAGQLGPRPHLLQEVAQFVHLPLQMGQLGAFLKAALFGGELLAQVHRLSLGRPVRAAGRPAKRATTPPGNGAPIFRES